MDEIEQGPDTVTTCSSLFQLVTGVWEGKYNFFCQGTHSAGEADMKVLFQGWVWVGVSGCFWFFNKELIQKMKKNIPS